MAKWETYEFWLTNDTGHRLLLLNPYILHGQFSRVANDIGKLSLTLDHKFDRRTLQRDHVVQIWRAPPARRLLLENMYFLRGWTFALGSDHSQHTIIRGPDPVDLLRRRIVAYSAGIAFTVKNDYADSAMVEIVQENFTAATDALRNIDTMAVGPQLDLGPIVDVVMHWKNVLDALKNIHSMSVGAGTEVFFDVVPSITSPGLAFTFRTYIGQPGKDRTTAIAHSGVLFADDLGNLRDGVLDYDYEDEATACYSLGDGSGATRKTVTTLVSGLHGPTASAYARIEVAADGRDANVDALADIGNAELGRRRRRVRMSGKPVDTESSVYGVDWRFGDRVGCRFQGQTFPCVIRGVVVTLTQNGNEEIDAILQYEGQ